MGYESRVYVMARYTLDSGAAFAEKIASFNLCRIGGKYYEQFFNAFNKEIDFDFYINGTETKTDCYGDTLKYCTAAELLAACKMWERHNEYYRRMSPFISYLETLVAEREAWSGNELICMHYGY